MRRAKELFTEAAKPSKNEVLRYYVIYKGAAELSIDEHGKYHVVVVRDKEVLEKLTKSFKDVNESKNYIYKLKRSTR